MQGASSFGLTAALYGELTFKDGRVEQSNFHDYPVLRMNEMPHVEVHIVQSREKIGRHRRAGRAADRARRRQRALRARPESGCGAAAAARLRSARMRARRVLGAALAGRSPSRRSAPCRRRRSARRSDGLAAFETVAPVLQHPRCQNCHIPGDAPLQFDAGLAHAQNVLRGAGRQGRAGPPVRDVPRRREPAGELRRAHAARRAELAPAAAGAEDGLHRALERRALRAPQGPGSNGGKDLAALLEHVDRRQARALGLEPRRRPRAVPVPHAEFVAKFKEWMDAGAPCPPK